jgi:nucleoside-diphosphate-sugar epimerase
MRILITGAGGFLGKKLIHQLLAEPLLNINGNSMGTSEIYAADLHAYMLDELTSLSDKVTPLVGDLSEPSVLEAIQKIQPEVIVHLAAIVSSAAEQNFDLGLEVNLHVTENLIKCCRQFQTPPIFIFSSSLAVFGCDDKEGNQVINDDHLPSPRSSYGTQKIMGEYLVGDATRKGFIHGRSLRFPTISIRPGKPNKAASSFASGIIREPLAGDVAILPVPRDLRLFLASPKSAINAIIHAISLPQEQLKGHTTITLPGLSITVDEMIKSLSKIAGPEAATLIQDVPDAEIQAIVATWPSEIITSRALALGFKTDGDFEELVHSYISDNNVATSTKA